MAGPEAERTTGQGRPGEGRRVPGERQRAVVVGGGTAGWMAAATINRVVGGAEVVLVESDEIGTVGVGEATIPQLRLLNALLGIDEDRFVAATEGTFKLGIEFVGWSGPGSRYLHAFGTIGRALGLVPFHHYWLRHVAGGGAAGLWDFSVSARAAHANRFGRPEEGVPSGMAWAFHFDAALYASFLRRLAQARGVARAEGRVVAVERQGESGQVAAVRLADGRAIAGDLFIDCSGFRSLLLGDALATPFEDWSRWLPCDRALAVPSARLDPLPPFTRATAQAAGWQWRIPLQHRTGNGHVFCSAFLDEARAADALIAGLEGAPLAEPRLIRFAAGRRREAWVGNVVALGLAAGFLEPLESTSIHLVQSGLSRLLGLWPGTTVAEPERAAFNRQTADEWAAVRDFLILHYHANARDGAFWRQCREMPLPDSLRERLDLFRSGGRLFRRGEELFTEVGWLQLLVGQGVMPAAHHPLADQLPAHELDGFLQAAARHAAGEATRLPEHAAFIARHAAAARTGVAA